jgi:hypothetical protein
MRSMPIPRGNHQTASLLKFVVICAIASSNHGAWPDVRLDHCDPQLRLRFDVLNIIYEGGEVSLGDADDRSLMSFGTMPLKLEMMLTTGMLMLGKMSVEVGKIESTPITSG